MAQARPPQRDPLDDSVRRVPTSLETDPKNNEHSPIQSSCSSSGIHLQNMASFDDTEGSRRSVPKTEIFLPNLSSTQGLGGLQGLHRPPRAEPTPHEENVSSRNPRQPLSLDETGRPHGHPGHRGRILSRPNLSSSHSSTGLSSREQLLRVCVSAFRAKCQSLGISSTLSSSAEVYSLGDLLPEQLLRRRPDVSVSIEGKSSAEDLSDLPTAKRPRHPSQLSQVPTDPKLLEGILGLSDRYSDLASQPPSYQGESPAQRHSTFTEVSNDLESSPNNSPVCGWEDGCNVQGHLPCENTCQKSPPSRSTSNSCLFNGSKSGSDDLPDGSERLGGTLELAQTHNAHPSHGRIHDRVGSSNDDSQEPTHSNCECQVGKDTTRKRNQPSRAQSDPPGFRTLQPVSSSHQGSDRQLDCVGILEEPIRQSRSPPSRSRQAISPSSETRHLPIPCQDCGERQCGCGCSIQGKDTQTRVDLVTGGLQSDSGGPAGPHRHIRVSGKRPLVSLHDQRGSERRLHGLPGRCDDRSLAEASLCSSPVRTPEVSSRTGEEVAAAEHVSAVSDLVKQPLVQLVQEESTNHDYSPSSSSGRVQGEPCLVNDAILAAIRTVKYSDLVKLSPFCSEAINLIVNEDPALGNPESAQRMWNKFRKFYDTNPQRNPFDVDRVTAFMIDTVKNQNRPRTTLQTIAGLVRHVTFLCGNYSQDKQDMIQKFIDMYVARFTLTPMARKGVADMCSCVDYILSLDENNEEQARRASIFLVNATTMWRQTSIRHVLFNRISPDVSQGVVLALPFDKKDKNLNGLTLRIPNSSVTRLSPSHWIARYIKLSESHRTSDQKRYLFIPLKNAKDKDKPILAAATISAQVKMVIGDQVDPVGNKVTPSSMRLSTQTRARRAGAPDGLISSIGNWQQPVKEKNYDIFAVPPCWTDLTLAISDKFTPETSLPVHPTLGTSSNSSSVLLDRQSASRPREFDERRTTIALSVQQYPQPTLPDSNGLQATESTQD